MRIGNNVVGARRYYVYFNQHISGISAGGNTVVKGTHNGVRHAVARTIVQRAGGGITGTGFNTKIFLTGSYGYNHAQYAQQ